MHKISMPLAVAVIVGIALTGSSGVLAAGATRLSPGDAVSINPQPLPPREQFVTVMFGDDVSINPQPLPPKLYRRAPYPSLGDTVSLNPQPLPPRQTFAAE